MSQIETNKMGRRPIYCLVLCAVLMALSFVLGMIKIIPMPYGGSITMFSMLAATLAGYFCGPKWGLASGVALGLLNLIIDPVSLCRWFSITYLLLAALGFRAYSPIKSMDSMSDILSQYLADSAVPSFPVFSSSENLHRRG